MALILIDVDPRLDALPYRVGQTVNMYAVVDTRTGEKQGLYAFQSDAVAKCAEFNDKKPNMALSNIRVSVVKIDG